MFICRAFLPPECRLACRAPAGASIQTFRDRTFRHTLPIVRILLTGSSGLIGRHLQPVLRAQAHQVVGLLRNPPRDFHPHALYTNLDKPDLALLDGFDAVIHLAGRNIAQRWTKRRRASILASRADFTRKLCSALAQTSNPPKHFLSASGIHYYGYQREEPLTEDSSPGDGFLAEVCRKWEEASAPLQNTARVVHMRLSVVLTPDGGVLAKLLTPFRLGMGATMGSGRQMMSWIALPDALGAISHVLKTPQIAGPVNFASPHAVSNREFGKTLARVLQRPAFLRLPAAVMKAGFGDMAKETILANQNVIPVKLLESGYTFVCPHLLDALRTLLGRN